MASLFFPLTCKGSCSLHPGNSFSTSVCPSFPTVRKGRWGNDRARVLWEPEPRVSGPPAPSRPPSGHDLSRPLPQPLRRAAGLLQGFCGSVPEAVLPDCLSDTSVSEVALFFPLRQRFGAALGGKPRRQCSSASPPAPHRQGWSLSSRGNRRPFSEAASFSKS